MKRKEKHQPFSLPIAGTLCDKGIYFLPSSSHCPPHVSTYVIASSSASFLLLPSFLYFLFPHPAHPFLLETSGPLSPQSDPFLLSLSLSPSSSSSRPALALVRFKVPFYPDNRPESLAATRHLHSRHQHRPSQRRRRAPSGQAWLCPPSWRPANPASASPYPPESSQMPTPTVPRCRVRAALASAKTSMPPFQRPS